MKKILLSLLILNVTMAGLFAQANEGVAAAQIAAGGKKNEAAAFLRNSRLELYFDDEQTISQKLIMPMAEVRHATRPGGKENFAAAVSTNKYCPRLPFTIRFGTLGAGGALSVLNSPELSSGNSPFSQSSTAPAVLTAPLPSASNFSRQPSVFLQAAIFQPHFSITANSLFSQENAGPVYSSKITIPLFKNHLKLSASFLGGSFFYEKTSANSWFLKEPFHNSGTRECYLFQFSVDSKPFQKYSKTNLSFNFSAAFYESPFGDFQNVFRSDFAFSSKKIYFFNQLFYNQNHLFTSSEKLLEPAFQTKTGFFYNFASQSLSQIFKRPIFIKVGSNLFCNIKLTESESPFKINFGLQINSLKTAFTGNCTFEGSAICESQKTMPKYLNSENLILQFKNNWKFSLFSPGVKLTFSIPFEKEKATKIKMNANLYFKSKKSKIPFSLKTALNFSTNAKPRDNLENRSFFYDSKFSASFCASLEFSQIKISGKITCDFTQP